MNMQTIRAQVKPDNSYTLRQVHTLTGLDDEALDLIERHRPLRRNADGQCRGADLLAWCIRLEEDRAKGISYHFGKTR